MQTRYKSEDKKAKWMKEYERLVIAARPELAGKIDWNTATFLFNQGLSVQDAASKAGAK